MTDDQQFLISTGQDGLIKKWDKESGLLIEVFHEHTNDVYGLVQVGEYLISGRTDRISNIFNLKTDQLLEILENTTSTILLMIHSILSRILIT